MNKVTFRASGSAEEWKSALADIRANHARLDGCPRHRFDGGQVKIGAQVTCLRCGGTIGLVEMGYYIAGYEAGGGSADDIWPGYRQRAAE